jgi:hypothetical protein
MTTSARKHEPLSRTLVLQVRKGGQCRLKAMRNQQGISPSTLLRGMSSHEESRSWGRQSAKYDATFACDCKGLPGLPFMNVHELDDSDHEKD